MPNILNWINIFFNFCKFINSFDSLRYILTFWGVRLNTFVYCLFNSLSFVSIYKLCQLFKKFSNLYLIFVIYIFSNSFISFISTLIVGFVANFVFMFLIPFFERFLGLTKFYSFSFLKFFFKLFVSLIIISNILIFQFILFFNFFRSLKTHSSLYWFYLESFLHVQTVCFYFHKIKFYNYIFFIQVIYFFKKLIFQVVIYI